MVWVPGSRGSPPNTFGRSFPTVRELIDKPPNGELWYTDDTQMMIGVAETLVEHRAIVEDRLCAAFVANYVPSRGYGRGARKVLEAMEDGKDHRLVAATVLPGGSHGNGAAMRVAPVGLLFRDDGDRVWEQARASALPTHVHPLGVEGAQLLALPVALASQQQTFDRHWFFAELVSRCVTAEFREKLTAGSGMVSIDEVAASETAFKHWSLCLRRSLVLPLPRHRLKRLWLMQCFWAATPTRLRR